MQIATMTAVTLPGSAIGRLAAVAFKKKVLVFRFYVLFVFTGMLQAHTPSEAEEMDGGVKKRCMN